MDHSNDLTPQDPSGSEPTSVEARLSLLERQLGDQQDRLRDYEKSLVERIADVDDDRRTTESKLQRAWNNQHEEIDQRLRRQTATMLAVLFLFVLLLAVVLFMAYRQMMSEQQSLVREVTILEQELVRLSEISLEDESLQEKLQGLTASVGEISASLERMDRQQVPELEKTAAESLAARDEVEAKLGSEVQRLAAEQQRLMQELASLREMAGTPPPVSDPGSEAEEPGGEADDTAEAEVEASPGTETASPSGSGTEDERSPSQTDTETAESESADDRSVEPSAAPAAGAASETLEVRDLTYGLQLIGFYGREELERFADRKDLPKRVYFTQDTYRGRPWFALIRSLHESYPAAEAELATLSPDLQDLRPWIRPLRAGDVLYVLEQGNRH
jgi:DamX protein